jgi:hypothetical protein
MPTSCLPFGVIVTILEAFLENIARAAKYFKVIRFPGWTFAGEKFIC